MEQDLERTLAQVGSRLRSLRLNNKATLQELSDETGISVSTLSRLESGQRRPTLEQLLPLARAHGVPLDDLVGAPATGDPRIHIKPITHHGMTILPLSRGSGGGLQAFKHLIPAGKQVANPELQTHEGYEWFYVLRGKLRLRLGEPHLILPAGEAAEFDTRTPHWFGRADNNAVEFLSLFGPQGERMHVRARPAKKIAVTS
ncbi:XRE family transcriptional regulator [Arthrobacter sp. UCD-GKA]|uniref:helix-turn-helix domain-containing protein n=1 Tax=Arthrobacter sp. UCD-GKA TaxID=1913576 RepID=UPI0008DCB8B8|nr:XRE family transcriptional regulator [Arthrobacter sp. UCD-GKA]OIH82429.1 XRE family transcriptional regulator [Arthrobacter sp. UCD-GKA]